MVKKAILASLFFVFVTWLFGFYHTPALAENCTTSHGWPGVCVLMTECNETNVNIVWQDTACTGDSTGTIAMGCCGVKPGAPENSRPGLGALCNTTQGWPGTCTKNIDCNQNQSGVAYDETTCKAGGCCGKQSPVIEASCATAGGWAGTCTTHDLRYCDYADPNYKWDNAVSPCKDLSGYGCCGVNPATPAGKSCITTQGWTGKCTSNDLYYCNYANPNFAWDDTVFPCKDLSGYGCCGVNPTIATDNTSSTPCQYVTDPDKRQKCTACSGVWTAIGCIETNPGNMLGSILGLGIGVAGGIAFLLILFGGLQIMTSAGNPEQMNAGRELISSAITGLLLIIFAVFLLRFIGYNIIGIPGFGTAPTPIRH